MRGWIGTLGVILVGCAGGLHDVVDFGPDDSVELIPLDGAAVSLTIELRAGPLMDEGEERFSGPVVLSLLVEYERTGDLICRQRVEAQGSITQQDAITPADCPRCSAELVVDGSTVTDLSDPEDDPDDCAPGSLGELDLGLRLVRAQAEGGLGDLRRLLFVAADSLPADPWSPGSTGSPTVDGVVLELANRGFRFEGFLLAETVPGSFVQDNGVRDAAAPLDTDGSWFPLLSLAVAQDTAPRPLLEGWFAGAGLWTLPLEP